MFLVRSWFDELIGTLFSQLMCNELEYLDAGKMDRESQSADK